MRAARFGYAIDRSTDWEREIAGMMEVYAGSTYLLDGLLSFANFVELNKEMISFRSETFIFPG